MCTRVAHLQRRSTAALAFEHADDGRPKKLAVIGSGEEAKEGLRAVAAVSTLLGFGLLALSDHPALFSIGAPSALGVLLCVVLAPTVRLLTSRQGPTT